MAYCVKCGEPIAEGQRFCGNCGDVVETNTQIQKNDRRIKVKKCPNCGEILNSFDMICQECGFEITDKSVNGSVYDLSKTLQKIDQQQFVAPKKQESFLKKTIGMDFKKNDYEEEELRYEFEEQKNRAKISAIENYPIPVTKTDLLEFLFYAEGNMSGNSDLSSVWKRKYDQVYKKAEFTLSNDKDFIKYREEKSIKQNEEKEKKSKSTKDKIILIVAVICIAVVAFIAVSIVRNQREIDGEIKMTASFEDFEGENYADVAKRLEKMGFTNITFESIPDLVIGWLKKDGAVEEVVIDGINDFSKGNWFDKNAEIIIRYHTFKEKG